MEIGGTILLIIVIPLAVMGGIGGGGVMVPTLIYFFKLSTAQAVAVSNFTIFTGSITRYITTLYERHTEKDSPIIEYGLANIMLPTVLIGTVIGVWFNEALPEIIVQFSIIAIQGIMAFRTCCKARELRAKEDAKEEEIEMQKIKDEKEKAENQELEKEVVDYVPEVFDEKPADQEEGGEN